MKVAYRKVSDLTDVLAWLTELRARTAVFDIEPLVAYWDGDRAALSDGVERVLEKVSAVPGIEVIGFATNSLRRLDLPVERSGIRVFYLAAARKPFSTRAYRSLPKPAVLVGDQVATDGLLAWRLAFAFAHVQHGPKRAPRGPRLMKRLGRPLTPWLFGRRRTRS